MPKEPEGTSSPQGDSPDSQADSHDSSQEQTKLKHSAASNVDDAKGEGFDQIQASSSLADKEKAASSQSSDNPESLENSGEQEWHHDDPYHHDYEHEDHYAHEDQHDDPYHNAHEEYQGEDSQSTYAPVPIPRSDENGGGNNGGDDLPPDLDEDGAEYGGPVKSFLEHMEDLRWVLIRCVAALGIAMVACLAGAPIIVDFLSRPLGEAKQFLTENRKEALLEERKSEILVRLTEEQVFRIPVATNLLQEAYQLLNLTNVNEPQSFNLKPAVEGGKLQLLLQPDTNTISAADESSKTGPELKSMSPLSGFLVALQMAFYGGIMVSLPFILYFLGLFVFPALRKKEKKYLMIAVIIGGGLFFCGAAFCYFLLMKIALSTAALFANWMHFGADLWRAEDYIKFVCKFMIGMGIAFELPVVILLLVKIGILDYKKLAKFRMYWVVINLVLASALTPPDIVTQLLMALPMQIFYELSILIAWIWHRRDKKREELLEKEAETIGSNQANDDKK
ncbi:MAG: twin-arginine translocase subunit TatC [Verrucomicrobiota bacterium]|jgi:sec-independent protein translocase protein TatC|nr:twin-arginine translocase subunit TatC [Verrucomicrobiota bacterium]